MASEKTPMRAPWGDLAPHLTEISNAVLFDDVWRRPALSPHDRSLITVASLISLYRSNKLKFHLSKALEIGVTRDEIIEMVTHPAFLLGLADRQQCARDRPRGVRGPATRTRAIQRSTT